MSLLLTFLLFTLFAVRDNLNNNTKKSVIDYNKNTGEYIINGIVDLQGDSLKLSSSSCLVFPEGGRLTNGVVVGNKSSIKGGNGIFENIIIDGNWEVPFITSDFFTNLSSDNSLRNVIALSSPKIYNTIYLEEGDYWVSTSAITLSGIALQSNTNLIIDGNIHLRPNAEKRSYIVLVENADNITISGKGTIIGDKREHLGTDGQWGMGIAVLNASNVFIDSLRVTNCWGDCIYVGVDSKNVNVTGCNLSSSRRQGISVVGCEGCCIRNCFISNVGGSKPEYAIDLEPNVNRRVQNVVIENAIVRECEGGILTCGTAPNTQVDNIQIINCDVLMDRNSTHRAITSYNTNNVRLKGNKFKASNRNCIYLENCVSFLFEANIIDALSGNVINQSKNVVFKNNQIRSQSYLFRELDGLYLVGNELTSKKPVNNNDHFKNVYMKDNIVNCTLPSNISESVFINNVFIKNTANSLNKIISDKTNTVISNR